MNRSAEWYHLSWHQRLHRPALTSTEAQESRYYWSVVQEKRVLPQDRPWFLLGERPLFEKAKPNTAFSFHFLALIIEINCVSKATNMRNNAQTGPETVTIANKLVPSMNAIISICRNGQYSEAVTLFSSATQHQKKTRSANIIDSDPLNSWTVMRSWWEVLWSLHNFSIIQQHVVNYSWQNICTSSILCNMYVAWIKDHGLEQ